MIIESNVLDFIFLKDGEQGEPGKPGESGKTLYTWIKYSKNADGSNMTDDPDGAIYVGFAYNKESATESTNPSDYSWTKIKGEDGKQGEDAYTIILSNENISFATNQSNVPLSSQSINCEVTVMKGSSVVTDFTIDTITPISGIDVSVLGKIITLSATSSTAIENDSGSIIIPITVQGYTFNKIISYSLSKSGVDGKTLYTWIRYADSPTSGISSSPDGKKYMGVAYNKTTSEPSDTYSDYKWSLIEGDGIASVETERVKSTDKTTAPTSEWSTDNVTWESGTYIWTRLKITYKSGSIEYTEPQVSSEWEAANQVQDNLEKEIEKVNSTISGVSSKVDQNTKSITDKVWQTDITNSINNYDNTTAEAIRERVTKTETDISGIKSSVSDIQTDVKKKADGDTVKTLSEKVSTMEQDAESFKTTVSKTYSTKNETQELIQSVQTIATQTADKFNWIVKSGTSSTDFTLTDRTATLIAETISLNGNVKVNGDMLVDGCVGAKQIAAKTVTAEKLSVSTLSAICADLGSVTAGSINIGNGKFVVDSSGNLTSQYIVATGGEIGCWTLGSDRMYDNSNSAGYVGVNKYGSGQAFWAGGTDLTGGSAPFRVGHNGTFVATNATISGNITASGGKIGCWNITNTEVNNGQWGNGFGTGFGYRGGTDFSGTDMAFWAGDGNFKVLYNGQVNISDSKSSQTIGLQITDLINGYSTNLTSYMLDVRTTGSYTTIEPGRIDCEETGKFFVDMSQNWISIETDNFHITTLNGVEITGDLTANGVVYSSNHSSGWITVLQGYAGLNVMDAGASNGFNGLARVKCTNGAWAIGALNGEAFNSFILAYANEDRLNSGTNGYDASFWFYPNGKLNVSNTITISSGDMVVSDGWIYLKNGMKLRTYDTNGTGANLIHWGTDNRIYIGEVTTKATKIRICQTCSNIGVLNSSGSWITITTGVSDIREKNSIEDLKKSKEIIMGLKPKRFKFNDPEDDRYHLGFIAQDVRKTLDATIGDCAILEYNNTDPDEIRPVDRNDEHTFTYSMRYNEIIPPHVALTQEHEREIEILKSENQSLRDELNELKDMVQKLIA